MVVGRLLGRPRGSPCIPSRPFPQKFPGTSGYHTHLHGKPPRLYSKQQQKTVIYVTHDPQLAALATTRIELLDGHITGHHNAIVTIDRVPSGTLRIPTGTLRAPTEVPIHLANAASAASATHSDKMKGEGLR